jgi:hydrogenase maturation factor
VCIVTGDTKVVERGAADRVFINTAGIGVVPAGVNIAATRAQPGDVVIVNGTWAITASPSCWRATNWRWPPRWSATASRCTG